MLTVRLSGKFVPFAASTVVLALLPFLGGSAPAQQGSASVVLAAGDRAAVEDAVQGVTDARSTLTGTGSTVAAIAAAALAGGAGGGPGATAMAVSTAVGGGFVFPGLSLPAAVDAKVMPAVLPGQPGFIHPVPGIEVSAYGPRIHPLLGRPMFHTGIDLSASCGTPIRAAAAGTVVYARQSPSWGLRTIIQHTPTLKTAYGHQVKFLVKEGDTVAQGQVIGLVGTTGWSTGCHLHFDVIVDNHYVDPAPYLGFTASGVPTAAFGPSYGAGTSFAGYPSGYPSGGTVVDTAPQTVPDGDVDFSQVQPAPAPSGQHPVSSPTSTKPSPTGTPSPSTTSSTPSSPKPTTPTSSPTTTKPSPTGTPSPTSSTPTSSTPPSTPPTTPSTTAPGTTEPSTTTSSTPPPATTTETSSAPPAPPETAPSSDAPSAVETTTTDPTTSGDSSGAAPADSSATDGTTTADPTGTPTP